MLTIIAVPALSAQPQMVGDVALYRELRYSDGSSKNLTLDLAVPQHAPNERRPAIVVIHGGGWLEGDKSSFSTTDNRVPGNILDFAALGFVAATINYRLSGEAPFPAGLDDCRAAVAWLRAHADQYHIDPARIGVWGNSAGGNLALLLAVDSLAPGNPHCKSAVQAAASDSGPLDLVYGIEHNQLTVAIERFLGGPPKGARRALYKQASPSEYVDAKLPPLMLIYGALDEQVDVRTADQFVSALSRAGHPDVTYLRLAAAGHCPHSLVRVPHVREAVDEFFVRVLKAKPPKPAR
jgi:acetyl esterase/lipase